MIKTRFIAVCSAALLMASTASADMQALNGTTVNAGQYAEMNCTQLLNIFDEADSSYDDALHWLYAYSQKTCPVDTLEGLFDATATQVCARADETLESFRRMYEEEGSPSEKDALSEIHTLIKVTSLAFQCAQ